MFNHTLSAILRGRWLLDKSWAQAQLPLVESFIRGQFVVPQSVASPHHRNNNDEFMVEAISGVTAGTIQKGRYNSFNDAPEGSIALIPIVGAITKYGGDCGEPGSSHYNDWVNQAKASPKIDGVLFKYDTPGGMVDGTATLADSIKSLGKPSVAFVDDGMMASAGMWLGSSSDEIFASQVTDTIGSIGVYTTIMDFRGWFAERGIKLHEIYAPQSSDKNKDYRQAIEGNYDMVEAELKFIASQFIKTVKSNRKGKINLEFDNPFTGKMYTAEDAVQVGLVDGIKTLDQAVVRVAELAQEKASQSNSKKSFHMFGNKFKAVSALSGIATDDITREQLDNANASLADQGITGVVLAPANYEASFAAAAKAAADNYAALQSEFDSFKAGKGDDPAGSKKNGKDILHDNKEDEFLTSVDMEAREMFARIQNQ